MLSRFLDDRSETRKRLVDRAVDVLLRERFRRGTEHRDLFGAGLWETNVENVAAWVKDPPKLKPGSKMPNLHLSDADAKAVAAYLVGLK